MCKVRASGILWGALVDVRIVKANRHSLVGELTTEARAQLPPRSRGGQPMRAATGGAIPGSFPSPARTAGPLLPIFTGET